MRKQLTALACGLALFTQYASAGGSEELLPAWVSKAVADQQAARGRPMKIDECTYDGKTVFLFTRLDVAEASDADTLYSYEGKKLCKFGEFYPPGVPRACDRNKLVCARTLHPTR
jgi:hypothetical protein